LVTHDKDVYNQGIKTLLPRHEESLIGGEASVEKWWESSTIKPELFLLRMKMENRKYLNCQLIFVPPLAQFRVQADKTRDSY
jgi:hypothetical protein